MGGRRDATRRIHSGCGDERWGAEPMPPLIRSRGTQFIPLLSMNFERNGGAAGRGPATARRRANSACYAGLRVVPLERSALVAGRVSSEDGVEADLQSASCRAVTCSTRKA